MKRTIFVCALLAATAPALCAQETRQSSPYQGTANPPPDDTITTPDAQQQPPPPAKPMPGTPMPGYEQPPAQPPQPDQSAQPPQQSPVQSPIQPYAQPPQAQQPSPYNAQGSYPGARPEDGTDDGIVQIAPGTGGQPGLNQRSYRNDPDGDIVHPESMPPGVLGDGAIIRARLVDRLSTVESRPGDHFDTVVASDVVQNGQVLIPAGAHIEGVVVSVSSGHAGGHGSMHLRPETVVLSDGSRYRLYAQLSGTPDSKAHVGGEGAVTPNSRLEKDGIEYAGGVGAGLVTGAILGGPPGALAGTIIGAGAVTVHLLVSHPQATLENGSVLVFTLNEPLNLVSAAEQAGPAVPPNPTIPPGPGAN
jgi:hypothetical protein